MLIRSVFQFETAGCLGESPSVVYTLGVPSINLEVNITQAAWDKLRTDSLTPTRIYRSRRKGCNKVNYSYWKIAV